MFSYKFILDLHKDLKNWVDGANKVSHGRNWKENVAPEYLHIVEKLQGISYTEAEVFMVPFLEELYEEKKETIKLTFEYANQLFEAKFQRACETIEQMTGNPLYREDFIIFLTSFPRGPYDKELGQVRICLFRDVHNYLGNFLHELQHFQVIHYYKEVMMKELSEAEFEFLKESLTVILNDECLEFMGKLDMGYPIHQALRRDLLREWRQHHNFQKLITWGCERVKKYITGNLHKNR